MSLSARCWCSSVWLWALCSWSSRSVVVVAGVMRRPHRHRVDQQADHRFRADHLGRPPRDHGAECDIMLTGQPAQQLRQGGLQHGVDGGVARARQLAKGPRGLLRAPETMQRLAARALTDPAGRPMWGCQNRPAPRARPPRAASRSRLGQPGNKPAIRRGRGQPLPVIAGEYFLQQDRHRPAIEHDVVIGQHKPVPVFCGADQRRPKGRLVGEVADRGAFGSTHPLDLLIGSRSSEPSSTYRQGATGSAGMICTGSSNCSQNRAARLGWRFTTACTASRSRC